MPRRRKMHLTAGRLAVVLPASMESVPESSEGLRYRQARDTLFAAHLSYVARFDRYVDRRPTEADASRRYQNNDEHLRRRSDRGYAAGARKGCTDGSTESLEQQVKQQVAPAKLLKTWRREWDSNPLESRKQRT